MTLARPVCRVWHAGTISKLEAAGVTEKILEWFKTYILDRRQTTCGHGVNSDWSNIFAGIPQGSILGPLLFSDFHINDIVNEIDFCIRLLADDTSHLIIEDDPYNVVTFNSNKTESLIDHLSKN